MNLSITLYELNTPSQKATINLIVTKDQITVSGYDIGQTTKTIFGSSDYEYSLTANKMDVVKLINRENEKINTDTELLNWFKANFSDGRCFSKIRSFFDEQNVKYTTFFWR